MNIRQTLYNIVSAIAKRLEPKKSLYVLRSKTDNTVSAVWLTASEYKEYYMRSHCDYIIIFVLEGSFFKGCEATLVQAVVEVIEKGGKR